MPSAFTAPRPRPRNTASKSLAQVGQIDVAAEADADAQLDPADAQDPVDLGLRETVHGLVGGDAVLVEAARLAPGLEEGHRMARRGELVGAGEAGGAGADHGHLVPVGGALAVELAAGCETAHRWR